MKRYIIGFLLGYLATSMLGIPKPSMFMWLSIALLTAIGSYGYFVWYKLNDDGLEN